MHLSGYNTGHTVFAFVFGFSGDDEGRCLSSLGVTTSSYKSQGRTPFGLARSLGGTSGGNLLIQADKRQYPISNLTTLHDVHSDIPRD